MKVLILDDQYDKAKIFCQILDGFEACQICHVTNSRDALSHFYNDSEVDLLILDLQIPEALGEDIDPGGGVKFVEYLELNQSFSLPRYILAVTSHQSSYDEYHKYFSDKGWTLLYGVDDKEKIHSILLTNLNFSRKRFEAFDIAILTALNRVELEAVLALPIDWERFEYADDNSIYYRGDIQLAGGEIKKVVATSCPRMGIAASTATAAKLLLRHNPRFLVMTGIAAGIEGKVNFGDVLIADPCWDWGSGKLTVRDGVAEFLSSPHHLSLSSKMRTRLIDLSVRRVYLDEIQSGWGAKDGVGKEPLNMHVGPVASGAVVLEDPETVKLVRSQHRETIGIEMEAYGVVAAACYASAGDVDAIVVKSVCDFANTDKNDDYQAYAAYTSAAYAYHLIRGEIF